MNLADNCHFSLGSYLPRAFVNLMSSAILTRGEGQSSLFNYSDTWHFWTVFLFKQKNQVFFRFFFQVDEETHVHLYSTWKLILMWAFWGSFIYLL